MSVDENLSGQSIGWIGTGRMGIAMATRLLEAGAEVRVYNRTREKTAPLAERGAQVVDSPADLATCDIVFTTLAGPDSFLAVVTGENGLLSRPGTAPKLLIDSSTISSEAAATARQAAAQNGTAMLDAPVSGNAKVAEAGKLAIVASGDQEAYEMALPSLQAIAGSVSYVGEGERARIVKICHNILLGVISQSLAEITVLAEKGGVPRRAFIDFINGSVMGSMFTRYKAPAYVNLDFTPTFTPPLLLKDLGLGLAAARESAVPMPVAAQVHEIVQTLIGHGYRECDFAALLELAAKSADMTLEPDSEPVGTGL